MTILLPAFILLQGMESIKPIHIIEMMIRMVFCNVPHLSDNYLYKDTNIFARMGHDDRCMLQLRANAKTHADEE